MASRLHQILSIAFGDKTPALDIAGGYGLLVRHMRDRGYDFSWSDPYCENVFARGFEQKVDTTYPIVTAIEVLEHLEDPVGFIQSARQATGFEVLIMTTELYGDTPPALGDWWYYAPETGQHIGFYQERTMRLLAEKVGYQYLNLDDFHIFSTESVPTSTSMVLRRNSVARVIAYLMSRKRRSMTFDDHKRILRSLP